MCTVGPDPGPAGYVWICSHIIVNIEVKNNKLSSYKLEYSYSKSSKYTSFFPSIVHFALILISKWRGEHQELKKFVLIKNKPLFTSALLGIGSMSGFT